MKKEKKKSNYIIAKNKQRSVIQIYAIFWINRSIPSIHLMQLSLCLFKWKLLNDMVCRFLQAHFSSDTITRYKKYQKYTETSYTKEHLFCYYSKWELYYHCHYIHICIYLYCNIQLQQILSKERSCFTKLIFISAISSKNIHMT